MGYGVEGDKEERRRGTEKERKERGEKKEGRKGRKEKGRSCLFRTDRGEKARDPLALERRGKIGSEQGLSLKGAGHPGDRPGQQICFYIS